MSRFNALHVPSNDLRENSSKMDVMDDVVKLYNGYKEAPC
jgi:hypothetical protein